MKLLAIDPGTTESGFVVLCDGRLTMFDTRPNEGFCAAIKTLLRSQTDRCVIEMVGHYGLGMPAGKDVFETCVWIGIFKEAYGRERTDVLLRATVKTHVCGSAKAKDGNVRQALIDRFGGKERAIGTKKTGYGPLHGMSGDAWQALAAGLTYHDQHPGGLDG